MDRAGDFVGYIFHKQKLETNEKEENKVSRILISTLWIPMINFPTDFTKCRTVSWNQSCEHATPRFYRLIFHSDAPSNVHSRVGLSYRELWQPLCDFWKYYWWFHREWWNLILVGKGKRFLMTQDNKEDNPPLIHPTQSFTAVARDTSFKICYRYSLHWLLTSVSLY